MASALGVPAALVVGRLFAAQFFGIAPSDPTSIAIAVGLLASVTVLALAAPAARAMHTRAADALRAD